MEPTDLYKMDVLCPLLTWGFDKPSFKQWDTMVQAQDRWPKCNCKSLRIIHSTYSPTLIRCFDSSHEKNLNERNSPIVTVNATQKICHTCSLSLSNAMQGACIGAGVIYPNDAELKKPMSDSTNGTTNKVVNSKAGFFKSSHEGTGSDSSLLTFEGEERNTRKMDKTKDQQMNNASVTNHRSQGIVSDHKVKDKEIHSEYEMDITKHQEVNGNYNNKSQGTVPKSRSPRNEGTAMTCELSWASTSFSHTDNRDMTFSSPSPAHLQGSNLSQPTEQLCKVQQPVQSADRCVNCDLITNSVANSGAILTPDDHYWTWSGHHITGHCRTHCSQVYPVTLVPIYRWLFYQEDVCSVRNKQAEMSKTRDKPEAEKVDLDRYDDVQENERLSDSSSIMEAMSKEQKSEGQLPENVGITQNMDTNLSHDPEICNEKRLSDGTVETMSSEQSLRMDCENTEQSVMDTCLDNGNMQLDQAAAEMSAEADNNMLQNYEQNDIDLTSTMKNKDLLNTAHGDSLGFDPQQLVEIAALTMGALQTQPNAHAENDEDICGLSPLRNDSGNGYEPNNVSAPSSSSPISTLQMKSVGTIIPHDIERGQPAMTNVGPSDNQNHMQWVICTCDYQNIKDSNNSGIVTCDSGVIHSGIVCDTGRAGPSHSSDKTCDKCGLLIRRNSNVISQTGGILHTDEETMGNESSTEDKGAENAQNPAQAKDKLSDSESENNAKGVNPDSSYDDISISDIDNIVSNQEDQDPMVQKDDDSVMLKDIIDDIDTRTEVTVLDNSMSNEQNEDDQVEGSDVENDIEVDHEGDEKEVEESMDEEREHNEVMGGEEGELAVGVDALSIDDKIVSSENLGDYEAVEDESDLEDAEDNENEVDESEQDVEDNINDQQDLKEGEEELENTEGTKDNEVDDEQDIDDQNIEESESMDDAVEDEDDQEEEIEEQSGDECNDEDEVNNNMGEDIEDEIEYEQLVEEEDELEGEDDEEECNVQSLGQSEVDISSVGLHPQYSWEPADSDDSSDMQVHETPIDAGISPQSSAEVLSKGETEQMATESIDHVQQVLVPQREGFIDSDNDGIIISEHSLQTQLQDDRGHQVNTDMEQGATMIDIESTESSSQMGTDVCPKIEPDEREDAGNWDDLALLKDERKLDKDDTQPDEEADGSSVQESDDKQYSDAEIVSIDDDTQSGGSERDIVSDAENVDIEDNTKSNEDTQDTNDTVDNIVCTPSTSSRDNADNLHSTINEEDVESETEVQIGNNARQTSSTKSVHFSEHDESLEFDQGDRMAANGDTNNRDENNDQLYDNDTTCQHGTQFPEQRANIACQAVFSDESDFEYYYTSTSNESTPERDVGGGRGERRDNVEGKAGRGGLGDIQEEGKGDETDQQDLNAMLNDAFNAQVSNFSEITANTTFTSKCLSGKCDQSLPCSCDPGVIKSSDQIPCPSSLDSDQADHIPASLPSSSISASAISRDDKGQSEQQLSRGPVTTQQLPTSLSGSIGEVTQVATDYYISSEEAASKTCQDSNYCAVPDHSLSSQGVYDDDLSYVSLSALDAEQNSVKSGEKSPESGIKSLEGDGLYHVSGTKSPESGEKSLNSLQSGDYRQLETGLTFSTGIHMAACSVEENKTNTKDSVNEEQICGLKQDSMGNEESSQGGADGVMQGQEQHGISKRSKENSGGKSSKSVEKLPKELGPTAQSSAVGPVSTASEQALHVSTAGELGCVKGVDLNDFSKISKDLSGEVHPAASGAILDSGSGNGVSLDQNLDQTLVKEKMSNVTQSTQGEYQQESIDDNGLNYQANLDSGDCQNMIQQSQSILKQKSSSNVTTANSGLLPSEPSQSGVSCVVSEQPHSGLGEDRSLIPCMLSPDSGIEVEVSLKHGKAAAVTTYEDETQEEVVKVDYITSKDQQESNVIQILGEECAFTDQKLQESSQYENQPGVTTSILPSVDTVVGNNVLGPTTTGDLATLQYRERGNDEGDSVLKTLPVGQSQMEGEMDMQKDDVSQGSGEAPQGMKDFQDLEDSVQGLSTITSPPGAMLDSGIVLESKSDVESNVQSDDQTSPNMDSSQEPTNITEDTKQDRQKEEMDDNSSEAHPAPSQTSGPADYQVSLMKQENSGVPKVPGEKKVGNVEDSWQGNDAEQSVESLEQRSKVCNTVTRMDREDIASEKVSLDGQSVRNNGQFGTQGFTKEGKVSVGVQGVTKKDEGTYSKQDYWVMERRREAGYEGDASEWDNEETEEEVEERKRGNIGTSTSMYEFSDDSKVLAAMLEAEQNLLDAGALTDVATGRAFKDLTSPKRSDKMSGSRSMDFAPYYYVNPASHVQSSSSSQPYYNSPASYSSLDQTSNSNHSQQYKYSSLKDKFPTSTSASHLSQSAGFVPIKTDHDDNDEDEEVESDKDEVESEEDSESMVIEAISEADRSLREQLGLIGQDDTDCSTL